MSKAYFSQVDKASMLALLEEGFMFNYADPKSKSSSGHTNDTSVRLGLLDGDVKAVVMTYKMNIPLSEVVSLKEKGIGYDELYLMGELEQLTKDKKKPQPNHLGWGFFFIGFVIRCFRLLRILV